MLAASSEYVIIPLSFALSIIIFRASPFATFHAVSGNLDMCVSRFCCCECLTTSIFQFEVQLHGLDSNTRDLCHAFSRPRHYFRDGSEVRLLP
jgi:hypothetical protein